MEFLDGSLNRRGKTSLTLVPRFLESNCTLVQCMIRDSLISQRRRNHQTRGYDNRALGGFGPFSPTSAYLRMLSATCGGLYLAHACLTGLHPPRGVLWWGQFYCLPDPSFHAQPHERRLHVPRPS